MRREDERRAILREVRNAGEGRTWITPLVQTVVAPPFGGVGWNGLSRRQSGSPDTSDPARRGLEDRADG